MDVKEGDDGCWEYFDEPKEEEEYKEVSNRKEKHDANYKGRIFYKQETW